MKIKKLLLVLLIAIMIILCGSNFVYADSLAVVATSDRANYAPGQTVIVTVSLKNIDSSTGVFGLSGTLIYDETIFEKIVSDNYGVSESITALNNWGTLSYNSEYEYTDEQGKKQTKNFFSLDAQSPLKTDKNVLQIALKVKEDAKLGSADIILTELVAGNGEGQEFSTSAEPLRVNITESSGGDIPVIDKTPTPEEPKKETPIPATKTPIKTPTKAPTKTPVPSNKLPQAGLNGYILPALFVGLIVSLVSYIAYKRYKGI